MGEGVAFSQIRHAAQAGAAPRTEKLEHLRKQLAESATLARQLGVSDAQAVRLFRQLLENSR